MSSGLDYEAEKLLARLSECEEAFRALKEAAVSCSEVLKSGRGREEALSMLSSFLEALGKFIHELSHLSLSASTILAKLEKAEEG
ncbi:MAG TPA: hypothetical protein ENF78_02695 [Candidatus Bathyarchaeota archaeon]|nr:hypothetical protein [Candidatus Bathyarchaeota archaeon]